MEADQRTDSHADILVKLIATQCRVADAKAGAILSLEADGPVKALVVSPPGAATSERRWLETSAGLAPDVAESGLTRVAPIDDPSGHPGVLPCPHVVLIPMRGAAGSPAVATYLVAFDGISELDRARERIELTMGLLGLYELRLAIESRSRALERLGDSMRVLDSANEHERARPASMAFCNELAARLGADRVSLGFLSGRYVKTFAISHTERFDRKTKVVQDIEGAMEECLDQDIEIMHPPAAGSGVVSRAAKDLSVRHGPCAVLSLPLRHDGRAVGAVTIESPLEQAIADQEIETIRLTCDLCTAHLLNLHETDRWIGALVADHSRRGLEALFGPRHAWAKLIALLTIGFILFVTLVKGEDRVGASFQLMAMERRAIPAPFDGQLLSVHVEPGDAVRAGITTLAKLDSSELRLRLSASKAERAAYLKEADLALRESRTAEVQIAEANAQKAQAEIALLEYQVARAVILAPIDGVVVQGDLKREIGAPVRTGDLLFEVAPLDEFMAELEVPEDRIGDLGAVAGAEPRAGRLASASHPGDYIPFEVRRINPVAEIADQNNVFRVRVRLLEKRDWFRPGMEGIAKVTVGRRSYVSLWTRRPINWVRMKLWI